MWPMFFTLPRNFVCPKNTRGTLIPHTLIHRPTACTHIWHTPFRCELQSKAKRNRCLQSCLGGSFFMVNFGRSTSDLWHFLTHNPPPLPKREETEKNWEVDVTKIISVRMPPSPSPPEAGDTGVIITFYMIIWVNLTLEKKLTVSFSTDVIWAIAKVVKAHIRSNPKMKSMLWCIIKKWNIINLLASACSVQFK